MTKKSIKTNKIFLFLSLTLGFLSLLSMAHAQESSASLATETSTTSISEDLQKPTKRMHWLLDLTASSNLYREGSQRESSTDLTLNPSYELTKKIKLGAKGVISRDNNSSEDTQEGNSSVSNISLKLGMVGPQWGNVKSAYSVAGIAPTNETSRKRDRLQGAAAIGGGLETTWKRLTAGYAVALQRNFHEFNLNADGSANIQYTLSHSLTQGIDLGGPWSLSFEELYKQGWTYRSFQRQSYGFGADVSYAVNKEWQVTLGMANEGAVFKPNGTESNVELYDQNTSTIHIGITFVN